MVKILTNITYTITLVANVSRYGPFNLNGFCNNEKAIFEVEQLLR
jgi:hypothetical protein